MIANAESRKLKEKYSEDLLIQIVNTIKGKSLVIGEERHITVDEERYPELNDSGQRGKAYAYLDGFTRELVVDFVEYEDKKDKLGYNVIKIVHFKEYKVVY